GRGLRARGTRVPGSGARLAGRRARGAGRRPRPGPGRRPAPRGVPARELPQRALRAARPHRGAAGPVGGRRAGRPPPGAPAAGWYHARLGDLDRAEEYCGRALGIARGDGYRGGEAAALDSLGLLAQRAGRHEEALARYGAALGLCRELGNTYQEAGALDRLGESYAATGRDDEA